jgi:CheY-like chemotaxis protein/HPt (histidine-containing phosphotransfer) domain-containing protein
MRILVVEDNSVSRDLAMHMLRQMGHEVSMAGNGREAVEHQAEKPFDLIVMDIWMPEMDGLEACRKIREGEVGTGRRTPIIALTAHAIRGDRDACLASGMDEYLTKPIRRQILVEAIQRVTSGAPLAASVSPVSPVSPVSAAGSSPVPPVSAVAGKTENILGPWVGADADVLFKLGPVMIDSTKTSLADLNRALAESAWLTLEREAHSLKGSLGIFHASSTVATVKRIEDGARRRDGTTVAALLQQLAIEIEQVHREVLGRCTSKS